MNLCAYWDNVYMLTEISGWYSTIGTLRVSWGERPAKASESGQLEMEI